MNVCKDSDGFTPTQACVVGKWTTSNIAGSTKFTEVQFTGVQAKGLSPFFIRFRRVKVTRC